MNTQSSTSVQRVWNYCNVLRDDGISNGDYVEQLTDLIFLKMDDEITCWVNPAPSLKTCAGAPCSRKRARSWMARRSKSITSNA